MNKEQARRLESQESLIEKHLKTGQSISPIRALNLYGCFRLAAIIHLLKNRKVKPLNIETIMVYEHPVKFAKYKLAR